jgi:uncharacterized membrane protein
MMARIRRRVGDSQPKQRDIVKPEPDKIIYVLAFIIIIYAIYWIAVDVNLYNNYNELADLGGFTMSFWYDIHLPNIAHGLQFIVFDNHVSPDMLLVLPFYAAYQSPVTLLVVQVIMICLTSALLYLIAKDLLKDKTIAFMMSLAFLITPATWFMLISEFHTEPFFIPFYLLVFYFFMKKETVRFMAASVPLLGVMEFSPFIGGTLGMGLLLYCFLQPKRDLKQMKLAGTLVVFSIIAYILYSLAINQLISGYANGVYPNVPALIQMSPNLSAFESLLIPLASNINSFGIYLATFPAEVILAFCLAFLSFGIAGIYKPHITLILLAPWLVNAILLADASFYDVTHYYGFALGGVIISALIGVLSIQQKKKPMLSLRAVKYTLVIFLIGLVIEAIFLLSQNIFFYQLGENFLFQHTPTQQTAVNQLSYVVNQLPANASVYTTYFIEAHVTERPLVGILGVTGFGLASPDYVLVDFNTTINYPALAFDQVQSLASFMDNNKGNYTIYAENGTATLYKRIK